MNIHEYAAALGIVDDFGHMMFKKGSTFPNATGLELGLYLKDESPERLRSLVELLSIQGRMIGSVPDQLLPGAIGSIIGRGRAVKVTKRGLQHLMLANSKAGTVDLASWCHGACALVRDWLDSKAVEPLPYPGGSAGTTQPEPAKVPAVQPVKASEPITVPSTIIIPVSHGVRESGKVPMPRTQVAIPEPPKVVEQVAPSQPKAEGKKK